MRTRDFDEPFDAMLDRARWSVVAEEGDVALSHPLVFHAPNPNPGSRPRVMAQPAFSMTEPVRTHGYGLHSAEV